jgi:hypothetical protein
MNRALSRVWLFALRLAVAASYLTLAIADPSTAGDLAGPYAAVVLVVAVIDLRTARRPTT